MLNFENPVPKVIHNSDNSHWVHEKEIRIKAETITNKFSANLRTAMNEYAQGLCAMSSYFDGIPEHSHREKADIVEEEIIHHVASAFRLTADDVGICSDDIWRKFQTLVVSNLSYPLDSLNNTSELDRDARICKFADMKASMMASQRPKEVLNLYFKFLRQSKSKYPNEFYFHRMSLYMASISEEKFGTDAGLHLEKTVKMFPSHEDILYLRAVIVANRSVEQLTKEQAYLDFIKIAPQDHNKLPDVFYRLAELNGKCNNLKQCRIYYERGVEMEKNLLPIYLPYKSEGKQVAEKMLKL